MYGALTSNGLSRLLPVSGTAGMRVEGCKGVGAKEYNRVIEDLLVPEGNGLFQGQPFDVVEDGAPAHRSQLVSRTWNKHPHITARRVAPCSLGIHPLENVWNIVDDNIVGMNSGCFSRFLNEPLSQWAQLGPPFVQKVVRFRPKKANQSSGKGRFSHRKEHSCIDRHSRGSLRGMCNDDGTVFNLLLKNLPLP